MITIEDTRYPTKLRKIKGAPDKLYILVDEKLLQNK